MKKTGRLVICDTDNRTGSAASEIASRISQNDLIKYLNKEICILASEDYPVPFARNLEEEIVLTKEKVVSGIIKYMK